MPYLENTDKCFEVFDVKLKDISFEHVNQEEWGLFVNDTVGELYLGECNEQTLVDFADHSVFYVDEGEHSIVLEGWVVD